MKEICEKNLQTQNNSHPFYLPFFNRFSSRPKAEQVINVINCFDSENAIQLLWDVSRAAGTGELRTPLDRAMGNLFEEDQTINQAYQEHLQAETQAITNSLREYGFHS